MEGERAVFCRSPGVAEVAERASALQSGQRGTVQQDWGGSVCHAASPDVDDEALGPVDALAGCAQVCVDGVELRLRAG